MSAGISGSAWRRGRAVAILRMPPFPGARAPSITVSADNPPVADGTADFRAGLAAMRGARVGGTYWAAQPLLEAGRTLIARPADAGQARAMLDRAEHDGLLDRLLLWLPSTRAARWSAGADVPVIVGACDPWHVMAHADQLWLDAGDEVVLLARIAGRAVACWGDGPFAALVAGDDEVFERIAAEHLLRRVSYRNPFSGGKADLHGTIAMLGHWRSLIDANRPIVAATGFARWKRATVAPLLWNGSVPVRFIRATVGALAAVPDDRAIALWKSRVPLAFLAATETRGIAIHEVEDGFIRSSGLGANCVPPLSIVVDRLGVHFDPRGPSELERMLEEEDFPADLLDRAARLQRTILASGISKYGVGQRSIARPAGDRRHILVPGQVEDDRSVLSGGEGVGGNLGLLRRVRAAEPDAFILYKPHPDVEAGHRKGHVPEAEVRQFVDLVVRDVPISPLLDMVDAVHVMTSLAGFEALIRGKPVTTHGVPFYAGWGLTTDLGAIPSRRTRSRNVIEMIAAVLLLYPRYVDPTTQLPCPPEMLIERLISGVKQKNWLTVAFRRVQGVLVRVFARAMTA